MGRMEGGGEKQSNKNKGLYLYSFFIFVQETKL